MFLSKIYALCKNYFGSKLVYTTGIYTNHWTSVHGKKMDSKVDFPTKKDRPYRVDLEVDLAVVNTLGRKICLSLI